ncbi:uncharacterized protein LOC105175040 isoform X2 [Sesamum indicum]|uniref:Uncharacterized protein LOC105175040 isoform X2 n=1 Tax=Sesamum indicum TaxID=4182 RepID=A0A8M8V5I0_SESIN|nr:uncharacterized protein LOC105175040 isoform X2 [Sesamum indicum]
MLSTENPPPDLPCPCEISQLKSSSSNVSSDERGSDHNNLHQLEVDLLKSGLDDNNHPLPQFSIRDYVFNTRGKDIKNNWPFSQKNLQLCLKYGVKDVLPPFQSLDSLRNPSIVKCAVENIRYSDVKLSELSNHGVGQNLGVNIENIKSSGSEEDLEVPSSTISQSCSDINSVAPVKTLCLEPEAEYSLGSHKEKPRSAVQVSNKVESNIQQNPVKKCRLIVKLNNIAESKSNEDLAANASVVSETMASKVCPVCKTFSSSSNTTLNAHIDQCLSGESTIKWTTNSKVIKHRIKPRKTRLMVDIYETAQHCTLEDLDRRNGTNWASNFGSPVQDFKVCAEEKHKKAYSSVNIEDINEEGAVYIDSSGTKLRILSKLSDQPSISNAKYDSGPSELVKRDKESKFPSHKKKKYLVRKDKLPKHSPHGQGSCSQRSDHWLESTPYGQKSCLPTSDHCLEVNNGHPREFSPEGYKKEFTVPLTSYDQMKSGDFGMIKQWVGSKRTGLKKKFNLKHENRQPDKITKNLRVKCAVSSPISLPDTFMRSCASKSPVSSDENPILCSENHERKDNYNNTHDGYMEQPCQRKRPGVFLSKSQDCHGKKNHMVFSKFNVKQSRKDSFLVQEWHIDPPNGTENHVSFASNKRMGINISAATNTDSSFISSRLSHHHAFSAEGKEFASLRKTSLNHAISPGSKKFSSARKKPLSVRHASAPEAKKNLGRKHLNLKNTRPYYTSAGSDEEALPSQSAIHSQDSPTEILGENAAQMEKVSGMPLIDRTRVLKIQKKREGFIEIDKGDTTLKGSETSHESDHHGIRKNVDCFMGGNTPVNASTSLEEVEIRDQFVCEPTYKVADGETFVAFSKSLDSAFHGIAGPSDVECVSQHYSKAYEGHCPATLVLGGEQEMFCTDKVGKVCVTSNSHVVTEMGADESQGNYFVDVDPIPIPGPPGSFLPSPGRMGSEELQGNSSLTTCRIQSSEDDHGVVDMDSSDSPISALSAASNSVAARSDSVSIINLSVQSHVVPHETQCEIIGDRNNPVVQGSPPFKQAAIAERELNLHESRTNLAFPEVDTCEFKNIQPCCCSRKEGALQSGSLSYQESQLFRRRTMNPSSVLAKEKQVADDTENKTRSFSLTSEIIHEKEPAPESERNAANSPLGYAPELVSHNSEPKFQTCGDCESPSPSTSNPVLRLMGKNLMVINKDENPSPQTRPTQSRMVIEDPGLRFCFDNGLSTSNNRNEPHSHHHTLSRGPTIDNMQRSIPAQHFGFNSSDCLKLPANFRPQQLSVHPSTVMLSTRSFGANFSSSLQHREYTDSSGSKLKEIIVIDDSPENEVGLGIKRTRDQVNSEVGGSSVGITASMASRCDSNPFYSYQTRGYPVCTGSPVVHNGNIQVQPSKGMNANLSRWNCSPEGSNILQPNSLAASVPSTAHLRSSLYFSPGFS